MGNLKKWLIFEEGGQGMVEYSLIIAFIGIALILSFKTFGDKLQYSFNESSNKIP